MTQTNPIKRLGAIGDIHAEDQLLNQALQFLNTQALDVIVCVGDIADGSGSVNACCDSLKTENVLTVKGNHDNWLLDNTIRGIPEATPLSALSNVSHTHFKMVRQIGPLIIINAGTLKWAHQSGFAIVDFETSTVQFYEFYSKGESIEKTEQVSW